MKRLAMTAGMALGICAATLAQTGPANETGQAHSAPQVSPPPNEPDDLGPAIQQADARLAVLRREIESATGHPDLVGQAVWPQLNDLADQRERLMITLAGLKAREEETQKQIATITARADQRLHDDETMQQLSQIAALKQKKAETEQLMVKTGQIAASDIDSTVEAAAEAAVRVAERREAILAAEGGGALAALNKELLSVSLDLRQQEAMRDYLDQRISAYLGAQKLNQEYILINNWSAIFHPAPRWQPLAPPK